jgi:outer membrane immunogenic protein
MRASRLASFALFSVLASAAAQAADLPTYKSVPPLPEVLPALTWEGGYVGVFGGAMALRSTSTEDSVLPNDPANCAPAGTAGVPAGMYWCNVNGNRHYTSQPISSFNSVGDKWHGRGGMGTAGVTIGYNLQFGNFVYGAEMDWGAMITTRTRSYGPSPASGDDTFLHVKPTDYQTARVRLGYAFGNFLPFVTAGVAMGRFNAWVDDPDMPIGVQTQQTTTQFGYVLGAGLEYMISRNVTLKGEYLRMGFAPTRVEGYVNLSCLPTACPPQWKQDRLGMAEKGIAAWKIKHDVNLARVGLNYKF